MKKTLILVMALAIGLTMAQFASAQIITGVDRTLGTSGDRSPIGVFDGETDPLASDGGLHYFSDRDYPLVAPTPGEYVRTFNTDKGDNGDVNYAVTIGSNAKLQVFMDDRFDDDATPAIDERQALVDQVVSSFAAAGIFVDTGADINLNEGDSNPARPISIFESSVVYSPGTYDFGYSASGNNYYGIGAIPEPMTLALLGLGGLGLIRRRRK